MRQALSAVVSVRSTIPDDAFTAEILGTERAGYGAIIRENGLVLTIGYLTAEAETIWVTLASGHACPGHVLAYDFETGFGLVQILERIDTPALRLGDAESLDVGDQVVVAGSGPDSQTLMATIVARREFTGYWEYALDDALFLAPAHPNWGGTAVIDLSGNLVAIGSLLVQGVDQNNQSEDINMAVPVDILKPRLEDLLTTGRAADPPRPWLGLFATDISNRVVVMDVAPRGPAANSDIRQGDIVLAVDGVQAMDLRGFFGQIWALGTAGVDVPLLIQRDGESLNVTVKSADRTEFLKQPDLH